MKRRHVFSVNMIIVLSIAVFTLLYVRSDKKADFESQVSSFLDMTEGLSQVTANYLQNEQFVCDTWAAYINANRLSLQDALSFVRQARPKKYSSVHIIFTDDGSFAGYSIAPNATNESDFSVSYKSLNLFPPLDEPDDANKVNITRTYTNPMNGMQSIAFYDKIRVLQGNALRDALLLRIIPTSILRDTWTFPTDRYQNAQVSLIDFDGNYIIRGKSFKNSNFFEFYKSYNQQNFDSDFLEKVKGKNGTAHMLDSRGEPLLLSHASVNATEGWMLLASVPMEEISGKHVNWVLTLLISVGLLLLLIFNIAMLAAYNRQLALTAEAADAANKAKSNFLSVMSHDIRTPINAVLGLDEMVLREAEDTNIRSYATDILSSGKMLLALINDILDFSKIEAGKMEIIPADYDLTTLIADLVNIIQSRADAKGLTFTVNVDEKIPARLHGDDTRIKQCALNILTNAVKYTHKGGVTMNVGFEKIDDSHITLSVQVIDTGIGIKAEDLQKLYSPYQRIEESRNRNIEGTGLGMSIVKSLLSAMGSQLVVKSVYGEGSDFSFAVRQEVTAWKEIGDWKEKHKENAEQIERYTESFQAPDARILVVDDTPMNLTVVKGLLKATRIQIETAADALTALTLAHDTHFDLILADHLMPQMGGLEMLQKLRADGTSKNQNTVCIALTANAVSGAREMYLEAGFADYLTKPVDSAKLEATLAKYLPAALMLHAGNAGYQQNTVSPVPVQKNTSASDPLIFAMFGLDSALALQNCGSAETFREAVCNFHEAIPEKSADIERFVAAEDWRNVTVLVHALKSSARLIGATRLSERAAELEQLGNEAEKGNAEAKTRIPALTPELLSAYRSYTEKLAPLGKQTHAAANGRPRITETQLSDALGALREVLSTFDFTTADSIVSELDGYELPPAFTQRFSEIKAAVQAVDQQAAMALL